MSRFVHLHVHTQYSILDGASAIKPLIKRAKELGMESIAITDHGNMFGAKLFHGEALKAGVKPIIGCEVYVAQNSRFDKTEREDRSGHHLILLAKNLEGYHNLVKLVSYAWTEGLYYRPRIDKELLRKYSKGLICSSACLGGELPQIIMEKGEDAGESVINEFKEIFGDDYYLELQLHQSFDSRMDEYVYRNQLKVNKAILNLSKKTGVKCIVTNDVHFVNSEDAPAHDRLICLNTNSELDDPNRIRYTQQEYLKSDEEMFTLFPENPEAITNTLEIAEKIEVYSLTRSPLMPNFPLPENFVIDVDSLKKSFVKNLTKIAEGIKDADKKALAKSDIDILISKIGSAATLEELEEISLCEWAYGDVSEAFIIAKQFKYLEYITFQGAQKRYGENIDPSTVERIEFELSTIEWMGFPGYFLIVWDFIRAAREMDVSVGPGRGSAAGSVVAYCLGITNIDPIKYNLLFERFLNPERISMPDVDIDFDEDGREDVLQYVVDKYGRNRVANIITFGTMAAKGSIRDVARVQKLPLPESIRLTKMVPERPGVTLADAYSEVPELSQERESENPLIRDTLKYAEVLEGSVRQTGVHACGVIIAKDDLENYIPLAKSSDVIVVQYDGKHVEDVGLLKMDFLGLKTLSIIKDTVKNIEQSKGIKVDIDTVPLDDKKTFELYSNGDTTGLFQFESPGMKKHLRNLKPNRFEDLIAMNALYRPGPLEYIPNFIARKHGYEKIEYDLPDMEEYLEDTYGITVYQEQVMLLSQKLAGFTKGQADTLRKAMGKKQREVLDKMKGDFIAGTSKNGHDAEKCEKIWKDWEEFAKYAFNKSHSTCYAYVSYQTAYLKAHYPSEFMAALLSRNLSDIKKISFFMDECKYMGISVFGPDVNHSYNNFSVDKQENVRFGLGAVKGVGESAVQSIIQAREEGGEFTSVYDFVERVNLQTVNKKTIESLACSGAFDSISGMERSRLFETDEQGGSFIEALIRYGNRMQSEKNNAQQSLFGGFDDAQSDIQKPEPSGSGAEWSKLETLNKEREVVGIYLSSHPLDDYKIIINNFCNTSVSDLNDLQSINGRDFVIAGMVTEVKNLSTKDGKPYGRFIVEDYAGSYEFTLFSKDYEQFRNFCYPNYYLLIRGKVKPRPYNENELEPKISSIMMLDEARETMIRNITLSLNIEDINEIIISEISDLVKENKGNTTLKIRLIDYKEKLQVNLFSRSFKVEANDSLINFIENNEIKYNIT